MPRSLRCLAATALCCLPAAPALAQAPFEPNDAITQAPVVEGSRDYVSAFETDNDVDYFQFFVTDAVQADITVTNTFDRNLCQFYEYVSWYLRMPDGTGVAEVHPTLNRAATIRRRLASGAT